MISLCILAHNEEICIANTIQSVRDHVSDIVLMDDFSTDNTVEIAAGYGARIFRLPKRVRELGFATAANIMIEQAIKEWILVIDADEIMVESPQIYNLLRFPDIHVWNLPRRKWLDWELKIREEYEAYPDWQTKLFRNGRTARFAGDMHVKLETTDKIHRAYRGPHIEHQQQENRTMIKMEHRQELYEELARKQGVAVQSGRVLAYD